MVPKARLEAISVFYRQLLGREPDQEGLMLYARSRFPLEDIYQSLYNSDEAVAFRKKAEDEAERRKTNLPLTVAMFVKNNEDSVKMSLSCLKKYVEELVVVDTGSTDSTISICEELGARVYKVGFSDFGNIRTITGHLARTEWVLGLDSDEIVLEEDVPLFNGLLSNLGVESWALPRKRWLDLGRTTQLETDVYPDWQYRLFRNRTHIRYDRRVHEVLVGTDKTAFAYKGPHIHHFQDSFKTGDRLKSRNELYKKLHSMDVSDGVVHEEAPVQSIDGG